MTDHFNYARMTLCAIPMYDPIANVKSLYLKEHLTPFSYVAAGINHHYDERDDADFHRKYPSIFIRFSTGDSGNMLDHNVADVIITLDHRLYNKDYIVAKEQQIPMHFVASSKSKFANRRGLSVKDVIGEPFVLTECGQGYRRVFDRELAKRSLEITPILEIGRTDIITSVLNPNLMLARVISMVLWVSAITPFTIYFKKKK